MSQLNGALRNRRILITGISGFIGGHLGLRLAENEGAVVTGSGRKLGKVSHLAEVGVELQRVELADTVGMRSLLRDQELLVHLAWQGRETGAVSDTHALNVEATESLIRAADEAGVRRFIFASSINAYGPSAKGAIAETHPVDEGQRDAYGRAKARRNS